MNLIFSNNPGETLDKAVAAIAPTKTFILVDDNTRLAVLPRLQSMSAAAAGATVISTPPGDMNKNLNALANIWQRLTDEGATRRSLLINAGGGMVTDMGAFAATTYKRGIPFVNIPTSLLGAVDASVGGKTGINFANLKNQIGAFSDADAVIISTTFFNTLPPTELRSGYAEMVKHALLDSESEFVRIIRQHVEDIDPDDLLELLRESVMVKKRIVEQDPTEQSIRRALNFGHTAGHAFESLAMERKRPVPHGYAVAYGMVTELVLSHLLLGFPSEALRHLTDYVKTVYGIIPFGCDDYPTLLSLMGHDKKNSTAGEINFTLLASPGDVRINSVVAHDDIRNALDITRDLFGI